MFIYTNSSNYHMSEKRHFAVVEIKIKGKKIQVNEDGGSYSAMQPHSAGRKAGARALRKFPAGTFAIVTVREKTRGSAKKSFTYKVKKVAKPAPKATEFDSIDKKIVKKFKHKYQVHKHC